MKYSLMIVVKNHGKTIDGVWLQGHIGTLESATEKAMATERANNNMLEIAVVEELSYYPDYSVRLGLKRLDRMAG